MPKLVFYIVQKHPGSDINHPDCFVLQKESDITVGDVINSFPLSQFGNYHIRFRVNVGDSYQWMDPTDYTAQVPKYNGGIFLKVLDLDKMMRGITRIPIEESICTAESINTSTQSSDTPGLQSDIQLDEDASKFTASSYEGKSETVIKAMKEREKELREKQIKALTEKKEREMEMLRNEQERENAKEKYGPMLDEWSTDLAGEKKNIRTLLTTLHTVMWEGSIFTPILMSDVLDNAKVKLYYRKAMLKVHPDKVQNGTPEQKYIAQRLFDALNQAWNKFQEVDSSFMSYSFTCSTNTKNPLNLSYYRPFSCK